MAHPISVPQPSVHVDLLPGVSSGKTDADVLGRVTEPALDHSSQTTLAEAGRVSPQHYGTLRLTRFHKNNGKVDLHPTKRPERPELAWLWSNA